METNGNLALLELSQIAATNMEIPTDIVPVEAGEASVQTEVNERFTALVEDLEQEAATLSSAEINELQDSTMPKSGNEGDIAFAKSK